MICPHCSTAVKFDWRSTSPLQIDEEGVVGTEICYSECPNCDKLVVFLNSGVLGYDEHFGQSIHEITSETIIYPKKTSFQGSTDIPSLYLEDYEEAVKVLSASSKASAALSRRLLQSILRDKFGIKKNTLAQEIQEFIELDGIPSHITDAVDAVRNIGNFAAHPTKNKNTGEIVSVENGEAEWLIEVIEALFDFTFIQPKKLERRRKELDLKLEQVGKPKMKRKKND